MSNPQVPIYGSLGTSSLAPTLGSTPIALTDADHTLAIPNETCYLQVIVTGSLTANRNVLAPLVAGFSYIVINNTAGGFAINFGGVTGAKVSIPAGQSAVVSCDGTNYLNLSVPGSSRTQVALTHASAAYTALASDLLIEVDTSGGALAGPVNLANMAVLQEVVLKYTAWSSTIQAFQVSAGAIPIEDRSQSGVFVTTPVLGPAAGGALRFMYDGAKIIISGQY
jgi:hypothetical protein